MSLEDFMNELEPKAGVHKSGVSRGKIRNVYVGFVGRNHLQMSVSMLV